MNGREIRCPDCDASVRIPFVENLGSLSEPAADAEIIEDGILDDDIVEEVVLLERVSPTTHIHQAEHLTPASIPSPESHLSVGDTPYSIENHLGDSLDSSAQAVEVIELDEDQISTDLSGADVIEVDIDDQEDLHDVEHDDDFPSDGSYSEDDDDDQVEMVGFGKRELPKDEIDMTAMVDVTFLLLIFFMVTASFTSEKAIQQKPSTSSEGSTSSVADPNEANDTVKILIDEFNAYTIIFPDSDEREATSKQELLAVLEMAKLDGASEDASTMKVVAHEDSIHAAVISAIDAGREKGFTTFSVSVVENFD